MAPRCHIYPSNHPYSTDLNRQLYRSGNTGRVLAADARALTLYVFTFSAANATIRTNPIVITDGRYAPCPDRIGNLVCFDAFLNLSWRIWQGRLYGKLLCIMHMLILGTRMCPAHDAPRCHAQCSTARLHRSGMLRYI